MIYYENINIQYVITILETEEKFKMVFTDYTTEYSYEIQCYGIFKYYFSRFNIYSCSDDNELFIISYRRY